MRIFLTNLGKYNDGELVGLWLTLPYTDDELQAALMKIGIGARFEEYFITDYECNIGLRVDEYESVHTLNEIAECISNLTSQELELLQAIVELESSSVSNIMDIIENLGDYTLHPDIHNEYALGHYRIHDVEGHNLNSLGKLAEYLDYEAYGQDYIVNSRGGFTSKGWLERHM